MDGDRSLYLPAWRFEQRVVWGLTHQMLTNLIGHLARAIHRVRRRRDICVGGDDVE